MIVDIQRLLYEKDELKEEKVIAAAVDIEERIYAKAVYDAGLKPGEFVWRKREVMACFVCVMG